MIEGLLAAMDELGRKPVCASSCCSGNGRHFQAGADLNGSAR